MGLRLMCVAGVALVALLLLLTATILRLALLLVQLVSLKYSLAVCALALAVWFVDSRRQCYAKGFYSCSRVPQAAALEQKREQVQPEEEDREEDRQETQPQQEKASVVPVALPVAIKKVANVTPSETESVQRPQDTRHIALPTRPEPRRCADAQSHDGRRAAAAAGHAPTLVVSCGGQQVQPSGHSGNSRSQQQRRCS